MVGLSVAQASEEREEVVWLVVELWDEVCLVPFVGMR